MAAKSGETPTQRREAMVELYVLQRLMRANANNLNQIARVANATDEVQPQIVSYLRSAGELVARLDRVIDDLAYVGVGQ